MSLGRFVPPVDGGATLNCGNNASLNIQGDRAIEILFLYKFLPSALNFVMRGSADSASNMSFHFRASAAQPISCNFNNGTLYSGVTPYISLSYGVHHVIAYLSSDVVYLILDGVLVGSLAVANSVSYSFTSVSIGLAYGAHQSIRCADLYYVRYYEGDISAYASRFYNEPNLWRQFKDSGQLRLYLDMKPVGGLVPDLSGNGNNGVITGPYRYVSSDVDDNEWWQ
jgi:hypothetical protein